MGVLDHGAVAATISSSCFGCSVVWPLPPLLPLEVLVETPKEKEGGWATGLSQPPLWIQNPEVSTGSIQKGSSFIPTEGADLWMH